MHRENLSRTGEKPTPIWRRRFEGTADRLDELTRFVREAARALGADDELVSACHLAADEAATNAFEHAYGGEAGRVEVEVYRRDDRLFVVVRHWGVPFDPSSIPLPDPDQPLEHRKPGGWGIFLMRQMMDDVTFRFDSEGGHTLVMNRRIAPGKAQRGGSS